MIGDQTPPGTSDKLPLVSIVIPAYNAEAFIGQTLRSVLDQSYLSLEVIVVDDGSRDRTAELIEAFAKDDPRVTLLRQPNCGVVAARNAAIEKAQGDYIAPIDADDIWWPEKLEKQVQCMLTAGPSVGLVYVWSLAIDDRGVVLEEGYTASEEEGDVFRALLLYNFVGNASTPLIRRESLERVGCYRGQLNAQDLQGCADWDLYLRIAERYHFKVVPAFLVGYRQLAGSMSTDLQAMAKSYHLMMADIRRRHGDLPPTLYRQSRSFFYLYLSAKSADYKNHRHSLCWLARALWVRPSLLLDRALQRKFATGILELARSSSSQT